MQVTQILDVITWIISGLMGAGLVIAIFSYFGWSAFWEVPKRIFLSIIGQAALGLMSLVFFLILGLLPFGLGKWVALIFDMASH